MSLWGRLNYLENHTKMYYNDTVCDIQMYYISYTLILLMAYPVMCMRWMRQINIHIWGNVCLTLHSSLSHHRVELKIGVLSGFKRWLQCQGVPWNVHIANSRCYSPMQINSNFLLNCLISMIAKTLQANIISPFIKSVIQV